MEINETDVRALRTCAALCWLHRTELRLDEKQVEQVLIAWVAVGNSAEAEAASDLIAARRESDRKQAKFDGLLGES